MADRVRVESTTEPDPSSPEEKAKRDKAEAVRAFLQVAKTRFQTVGNAERQLRTDMLDDLQFRASEQWDDGIKRERQADDRPCLTINRLPQFIRQVTNAQRQANLAVKVTGVDDGADIKTAEVIQGLIRHIEQQSDAQVAYSTAGEHQATMGRGYWRVLTEYDGPTSFVQNIRIKRVRNPFSVYMDPASQEADGSDARYAFIVEDMPLPEFEAKYGEEAARSLEEFNETADGLSSSADWMPEGKVRVAEYWYVESKRTELYLIEWATTLQQEAVTKDQYDQIPDDLIAERGKPQIIKNRTVDVKTVKQALISGGQILEGNVDKTAGRDWPGQWIPIVPALGDEIDINGVVDLRGMVRDAKGPQRLYNLQNSVLAETLAAVPRSPFIGAEGQFEGHEHKFNTANRKAYGYLEYKPVTLDNLQQAPPPARVNQAADIASIMAAITQSDQDLKATMGLYEPSLGIRQSSGQSGKAIEALKKQGEQANSNFLDNMSRAIRFTGRIIVDLIPHIYDATRVVRIIGSDETEKAVMVHAGSKDAPEPDALPEGVENVYDLSTGKYDVAVSAQPSRETKRAEALEALSGLMTAYPAAFPFLGDLLVGSLDWPGAQAAAERLKRMVPPQALGDDEQPKDGEVPPHVQQQIQQLVQQLQQLGMENQQLQQLVKGKEIEAQKKAEVDREKTAATVHIAEVKAETDLLKVKMQGEIDAMLAQMKAKIDAELAVIAQKFDHAHEHAMAMQGRADDRQDADRGRQEDRFDSAVNRREDRIDAARERKAESENGQKPRDLTRV